MKFSVAEGGSSSAAAVRGFRVGLSKTSFKCSSSPSTSKRAAELEIAAEIGRQPLTPLRAGRLNEARVAASEDEAAFSGLPTRAQQLFVEQRKVAKLYEWQRACLAPTAAATRGRNVIVSLPTGGGKTLVAEVLLLRALLCRRRDALLVLPFVSIVQEKVKALVPFGLELQFAVEEYAASKGRLPPVKRRQGNALFVATIEKANALVNALIEARRVDRLGVVVVDELHMLGDGSSRGALLEQMLAKLAFAAPACQIVGMSATLSNVDDLLKFLNAELFACAFRPVELTEYAKIGDSVFRLEKNGAKLSFVFERDVPWHGLASKGDEESVLPLVCDVIPHKSCLIFCPTKKQTESLALSLARSLPKQLKRHRYAEKVALFGRLRDECDSQLCAVLERCMPYGVAYHHSGLTAEERRLLQDAFADGVLCVLCCTSTLAAGVNLPAHRSIIRSPMIGNRLVSLQEYKQMVGRAGRAGFDTKGESFVILNSANRTKFEALLESGFSECRSSLLSEGSKGIRSLLLNLLSLKFCYHLVSSREDMVAFLQRCLLGVQSAALGVDVGAAVDQALVALRERGVASADGVAATALGRAAFTGAIDGDVAARLYDDLLRPLRTGLVLSTHLHLLCCVVPYDAQTGVDPDWQLFHSEFCSLNADQRRVFELYGVNEGVLVRRVGSRPKAENGDMESTLRRLYLALMLNRLWLEERVWSVAALFGVPRGWLQSLLQSSAAFASSVSRFAEVGALSATPLATHSSQSLPDLWPYRALLPDLGRRLAHCVQMELLPLLEIDGVRLGRARQLFAAGYKSVGAVSVASADDLMRSMEHLSRRQANQMIASSKMLIAEEVAARVEQMAELFGNGVGQPSQLAADFLRSVIAT